MAKQEKKRVPWLTSALAMGAAAAAAAVFLLNGQWNPRTGPEPTADPGPVTLVAPGGRTPGPTEPTPGVQRFAAPDAPADRLFVLYNHTMYWYNGESVPPAELGDLLTLTTKGTGDRTVPQPDGYTNLPEAGEEVRAIKGTDPVRRIAVHTSQGWYVLDTLPTDSPNK